MKKFLLLSAALIVSLGITTAAMAADSAYVNINITITENVGASITRHTTTADNLSMAIGRGTTANLSSTMIFVNNGTTTATWSTQITTTGAWTLIETGTPGTAVGDSEIRMAGIFYYDVAGNPTIANFSDNDVLTTVRTACTLDAFADVAGADDQKAVNVPPSLQRNLWLAVDAPGAGTTISTETYAVVVYATVS